MLLVLVMAHTVTSSRVMALLLQLLTIGVIVTVVARQGGLKAIRIGLAPPPTIKGATTHAGTGGPPFIEPVMLKVVAQPEVGSPASQKDCNAYSAPELSSNVIDTPVWSL